MNKRGLSQVVTSVLIILVVLAAVMLIWAFIRPLISQVGENIGASDDCIAIDLKATRCIADGVNADSYNVTVTRNAADGDLVGVRLLFFSETDDSVSRDGDVLEPLETKTIGNIDVGFNPVEVSVAAVVGDNSKACDPLNPPLPCSL